MVVPDRERWITRVSGSPLSEGTVHVWRAALDAQTSIVAELSKVLSHDEHERAERFALDRHRRRFVVGRACLRIMLGGYLRQPPADLTFSYGPHGKPALQTEQPVGSIRFNLAHSRDIGLYAFALGREVGVDVEHWHSVEDGPGIARRFFAPDEIRELEAVPPDRWEEGFFRCWTRKEAYIKARGEGLTIPLSTFSVAVRSVEPAASVGWAVDPDGVSRWSVVDIHPAVRSSAAIVAEGSGWTVERFQLPPWPHRPDELTPLLRQLK